MWDIYCEYRRESLAITTYELKYKRTYTNSLITAIKEPGEDALEIRNWLIKNRDIKATKDLLSQLERAYNLVIRQELYQNKNPFLGLSEDIRS